jgi:hypothetical protein
MDPEPRDPATAPPPPPRPLAPFTWGRWVKSKTGRILEDGPAPPAYRDRPKPEEAR